jgi:hypothetical protein
MAAVGSKSKTPTFFLVSDSFRATVRSLNGSAAQLPVVRRVAAEEFLLLGRSELNIANPTTHRRGSDADTPRDFLDRRALVAAHGSGTLSFLCFHFRKQ